MTKSKEWIKLCISLAGVLFMGASASAILLITVYQAKTNMIVFWDFVFRTCMIFGGAFALLSAVLTIISFWRRNKKEE